MSAIVGFAVGQKASENAWEGLVRETVVDVSNAGSNSVVAYVTTLMEGREGVYKEEFGEAVPTTYRTAKCVILKALKNDIPLLGGDGSVMGKTAIEKLAKEPTPKKDLLDKWYAYRQAYLDEEDATLKEAVLVEMKRFIAP